MMTGNLPGWTWQLRLLLRGKCIIKPSLVAPLRWPRCLKTSACCMCSELTQAFRRSQASSEEQADLSCSF